MSNASSLLREHARIIWQAAVAAVNPFELVRNLLTNPPPDLAEALAGSGRILVVGGGKAGTAMAVGVEAARANQLDRLSGVVNVPAESVRPLHAIRLHAARPTGSNHPTAEGVVGVRAMLDLIAGAGPHDIGLCLLSGGGSALLPAPVPGITLEDKQHVTALLHACGATINEMNCVRKHLSAIKGGRLAQAFGDRPLFSLIISDVIGDPLNVIASGPTAPDPTTFADALAILDRYGLLSKVPPAVRTHLERGRTGTLDETPKTLPSSVHNLVLGNNSRALAAAQRQAEELGYAVLNLGSRIEGETRPAAVVLAGIARSIAADGQPLRPPVCLLSGGETTVTLGPAPGRGGRNQEFVLSALLYLGTDGLRNMVVLSGGTDGEDGPTDAAGALADESTLTRATAAGLNPAAYLERHDAYTFFEATGDLLKTGLTQTNVMDVRVMLIGA
ncbi:MAG TPA: glycerate kinase [Gemmataceae bacterium]|jgi:hydroxypyruvate reductase/glycerate 2-kinase